VTCAQALACGWLVVTNPLPAELLPLETYGDLVADAHSSGCRTLVDLSPPRLESALAGEPDVVRINDWELAEFVRGPVSTPERLLAAAQRLRDRGARSVIITDGVTLEPWPDDAA
jgi:1-phosphofructokinase